jgi:DNA-binding MarR family transcriptional regulator
VAQTHHLSQAQYRRLAELRHSQRRFLHWSADQARSVGLTSTQHQLLLGIRAHGDAEGPTVGELADFLFIRPHSAVELVDRAQAAGLVVRHRDSDHLSQVHVTLTQVGEEKLAALTAVHLRELAQLASAMSQQWAEVAQISEVRR